MGGICVVVDLGGGPADAGALRAMAEATRYRGPDGIRFRSAGEAALAHLAFATTPEALGERQPITSPDGQVHLTADARIDNRDELTALVGSSIPNAVPSDAELILAAYLRWGVACPERLLGDFAFAVWDGRERRLLCARDPLGVKPLHYARAGEVLLAASEAQQVLHHPAMPRRLDERTLGAYLAHAPNATDRTFFRDVRSLLPAHRLVATPGGVRTERYWDVDPERRTVFRRPEEYAERFREVLGRAVAARLRTPDAAVGVAMSGGLDSTSVAALAQARLARPGAPHLLAASLVFDHRPDCDERHCIRAMADELGIEVVYFDAERHPILGDPETSTPYLDTPGLYWDGVWKQVFEGLGERGVKVVLTGHAGDLVLWATPLVFLDRLRRGELRALAEAARAAWRLGRRLPRALHAYLLRPLAYRVRGRLRGEMASQMPEWISPELARRLDAGRRPPAGRPRRFREAARQGLYDGITTFAIDGRGSYAMDRWAARWGAEVRHPFLDRRLLELVLAIPAEQLYRPSTKALLRRAMAGILPEVVRRHPKSNQTGFIHWSLRGPAAPAVERLLRAPLAAELGYFDGGKLREAYRRYRADENSCDPGQLLFSLSFEIWLRRYHGMLRSGPSDKGTADP